MKTLKLEHLENALESIKKISPELTDFVLVPSQDGRKNKFALAVNQNVKTDFMTISEMNQFLRGYMFRSENRFFKTYTHNEILKAIVNIKTFGGGFVKSLIEPLHRADENNRKKLTSTFQTEIEKYLNF